MLVYFLINLFVNHGFSSFGAKTNFLISSSFDCYKLNEPIEKNSDAYKLIAKKNLLAQYSKTSTIREKLLLVI